MHISRASRFMAILTAAVAVGACCGCWLAVPAVRAVAGRASIPVSLRSMQLLMLLSLCFVAAVWLGSAVRCRPLLPVLYWLWGCMFGCRFCVVGASGQSAELLCGIVWSIAVLTLAFRLVCLKLPSKT